MSITVDEQLEIARYTIQKINAYPKDCGKTVENYFEVLYQNEIRDYIMRRNINRQGEINRKKKGTA
jgi:hypothetical protein